MSLIWFDHYIVGLSSDTKPATHPNTGMPLDTGWSFLETDTNNLFMYIGMWQSCVNISGASATALLDVFTSTFKFVDHLGVRRLVCLDYGGASCNIADLFADADSNSSCEYGDTAVTSQQRSDSDGHHQHGDGCEECCHNVDSITRQRRGHHDARFDVGADSDCNSSGCHCHHDARRGVWQNVERKRREPHRDAEQAGSEGTHGKPCHKRCNDGQKCVSDAGIDHSEHDSNHES